MGSGGDEELAANRARAWAKENLPIEFRQRQTVYLLRVVVDDKGKLPIVITMYRTTNIGKYWKKS
jgi:hypothetical protein